jgi:voltage-gated potassium channel
MLASGPIRKIILGAGFCLLTCCVAVLNYVACGWTWFDAFYMTIITVSGVGYGEVHPIDNGHLKLVTMGLIIVGCSSAVFSVGGFIQLLAEGEIKQVLGTHRITRGIRRMKNHTIICGYGRIGQTLAAQLASQNHKFLIIDKDHERLASAEERGFPVLEGDASDEGTLLEAGIDRARCLASVVSNDASNVFITLTAREMNDSLEIIARAECRSTERKLLRSGANSVVSPAALGAIRIAEIIGSTTQATVSPGLEISPLNAANQAMV